MSNETLLHNRIYQSTTQIGHFNVRIVRMGDAYGRDNCLTHDEDSPWWSSMTPGSKTYRLDSLVSS